MPFTAYKTIGDVLKEYQITAMEANYIVETEVAIREVFKEELEFNLREFVFAESEAAVCETIVFPILREVYRSYRDKLMLWSHKALVYDAKLSGIPDYILAKRSPLGKQVFERPFFVAVEAKKDDFVAGWGQCLAEMLAMQKMNEPSETQTIFGLVSNGKLWEFGKLKGDVFTQNITGYTLVELERLLGAIAFIFRQCELQVEAQEIDRTD